MTRGLIFSFLMVFLLSVPATAQEINQTDDQGRKQGKWIKTTPDGTPVYEGQFVDDKPVGIFKRYYEDGLLKAEMNHRPDGAVYAKLYYHTRQPVLMAEGKYLSQKKDSVWVSYDTAGLRQGLDTYQNDVQNGRSVVYHENGSISEEVTFKDGQRNGEWKRFYPDGQLQAEGTFENGIRVGEYLKNYPNGKTWVKGSYENGSKESTWIYGNEDGSIGQMVVYRKGKEEKQVKMNGTFTEYYNMEKPREVANYRNGKLHGEYIKYYDNGEWVDKEVDKRSKGGEIEIYRVLEGQQIAVKEHYKDGELHGEAITYDEKGKITSKVEYVNGKAKD